jgi:tetratricopeptide (TPR) repeat protein
VATATLLVLALAGCASSPKEAADAKPLASQTEPLTELLARAQSVEKLDGGRERARLLYRDAAKAYPTDKRPWLRLAQSYFDLNDYGNAVLAAQEVVQRDPADTVAHGLLAVSGLRVSTAALSALRSQNNLNTSTRSEAEDMARNLRTLLGEPVLVPNPAEVATPAPAVRPPVRRAPAAVRPAAPPAPSAPAAATRAPAANPFGALQ